MPTGLTSGGGFVDSPPDVYGLGDVEWEDAGGGWGRAMVGGGFSDAGMLNDVAQTGFERIATGIDLGPPVPGDAGAKVSDWRAAFNWQHNPTFWIIVFSLAAIGFIHARLRVGGSVGRAHAGAGVEV